MNDVAIVVISKDEPGLADTLDGLQRLSTSLTREVVVVDASAGRLEAIQKQHPEVTWIDFGPVPGKQVTIPEQRNAGVRATTAPVVVFIDAGCAAEPDWLDRLTEPIRLGRETVTVGRTSAPDGDGLYDRLAPSTEYLREAPTINLAFTRQVFDAVGGFDERYEYGSDVDFTWRLRHHGARLRLVPAARITHDWGSTRRQLVRALRYGRARAQLYATHPVELPGVLRHDPILVAYPVFLALLPLTALRRLRWIPALLLIPLWRARHGRPLLTVADHLAYGLGALDHLARGRRRGHR